MSGTIDGGKKARDTNLKLYGEDFYRNIGRKGGQNGTTGGFGKPTPCECDVIPSSHVLSECAGTKGGRKSRRGKSIRQEEY